MGLPARADAATGPGLGSSAAAAEAPVPADAATVQRQLDDGLRPDLAEGVVAGPVTAAGSGPVVQRAGASRAATGSPAAATPYVDAPPGTTTQSVGVTTGDVVRVNVTGNAAGVLEARVTTGAQYAQVGATADALGDHCVIQGNTLFVRGALSNEDGAACQITITENQAPLSTLQPMVRDSLDLPIHAWKVTMSAEAGPYQGIPVHGEELDMATVIADVAALWRAAGIRVRLADTRSINLTVAANPDIAARVELGLKSDPRFDIGGDKAVNLVFVPIYERFGLTFSRYSRSEVDPSQLVTDGARQRGFAAPMAIIGVNGFQKPNGEWGSRSRDTSTLDGAQRELTDEDRAFHRDSLASDTAHELGHVLGLPHVRGPSPTLTNNPAASYAFSQLMHGQVAAPIRNLTGDAQVNQERRAAAQGALDVSAHPHTRLAEMRASDVASYSSLRGGLITDQFARLARDHIRSGRAFSQDVEDDLELEAFFGEFDDVGGPDDDEEAEAGPVGPEVLRGHVYRDGAADLRAAVGDLVQDGGVDRATYATLVMAVVDDGPYDSIAALTRAIERVLPGGKERVASDIAEYIADGSDARDRGRPVQRSAGGDAATADIAEAARRGTAGAGGALPHLDSIQRAFGRHDVGGVHAHTDSAAVEGARAMGASAFATGEHVAFAAAPDLHTAAHEAAHVVQQRAGVSVAGGVGQEGDVYERHADAVADAVVAGQSVEGLLDRDAGAGVAGSAAVQRKPSDVPAFTVTVSGALAAVGGQLVANAQVAALFAEICPGKPVGRLPTVIGLDGIAALEGASAVEAETIVTVTWPGGDAGRVEFDVRHTYFHQFLNEIQWSSDSADPKPILYLHKWDRNADAGGGAGAGLSVFRTMHGAATSLGMGAIVCDAIGDPRNPHAGENGYYTWTRFGFTNSLDSDMDKFRERLGELSTRIEVELPAAQGALGGLDAALAPTSQVRALDLAGKRQARLELKNLEVQGSLFDDEQTADLAYLEKAIEIAELTAERDTYGAALDTFAEHHQGIANLNDLFLAVPDEAARTQMALLWRGFGQLVKEATFDLSEGSRSNQVLGLYLADRGL